MLLPKRAPWIVFNHLFYFKSIVSAKWITLPIKTSPLIIGIIFLYRDKPQHNSEVFGVIKSNNVHNTIFYTLVITKRAEHKLKLNPDIYDKVIGKKQVNYCMYYHFYYQPLREKSLLQSC